nr:nucleoside deaminase [Bacteroidota bacterium]
MTEHDSDKLFLGQAIEMAAYGMRNNEGGPFGAVIVKDGIIVGRGNNKVTSTNDPTAHAEVVAIRDACKNLNTFQLTGCTLYTSCEPCPMCLAAIYWARPDRVVYGCSKEDAAAIEFDDAFIYNEIQLAISDRKMLMQQLNRDEAKKVFDEWAAKVDKTSY